MRQTLVLEGFPDPKVARVLSPNGGRPHLGELLRAKSYVAYAVWAAVRQQGLENVPPPALMRLRYVYPVARARDQDNATTGITKKVLDTLVKLGILVGDDSAVLHLAPVELVVEKGQRRLEIVLESIDG